MNDAERFPEDILFSGALLPEKISELQSFLSDDIFENRTGEDVRRALAARVLKADDLISLLSPAAFPFLEEMAVRAREETLHQFGKQVLLYAPLYLSNYCESGCLYCGFSSRNKIERKRMDEKTLREEARALRDTGIRHVLILTGCSRVKSPVSYIRDCIAILCEYFPVIGLEIYSLEKEEYETLAEIGAEELTIYQETYDRELYGKLHPFGPKRDYVYRLETPERACFAGFRGVNLGVLLGLTNWRKDFFTAVIHAWLLQRKYPETELSLSFPRMRPHAGGFPPPCPVSDAELVQAVTAWRIFMPRGGISLSTREPARLRDHLLPLGVTKLSAGSITSVGGYAGTENETTAGQFDIDDSRSVDEVIRAVKAAGYQPMMKNWQFWGPPAGEKI